ncbi:hypothetical protein FH972_001401 [Carpinus fangiana]|uniref:Bifunctional inhibitor/plant lipid transfer protein/seed storage helical domain-containing protein n=1 Tax=Carpinus fangiana TaxID=176857 RepID=A0A5N6QE01_9ROSI|nr:hypothetical protein FH972_001401 [Carpinus fangiana]
MEVPMKYIWFLVLFITLGIAGIDGVYGADECGKSSPDKEASKLAACAAAAQYQNAIVSHRCCTQVEKIGQNPKCLCAVLFSDSAKSAEIQPEVAMTVPKRCNIANRPVGYKCGGPCTAEKDILKAPMECTIFLVLFLILGINGFMNGVDGVGDAAFKWQRWTQNVCVAILSDEAKKLGVVPAAAVTIPKRRKLANRPEGYRCGGKRGVYGAGDQRGKSSIENEAAKLAPCTLAAHDEKAQVSDKCCTVVKNIDVSCLCAIMLSDIAKSSGIKPEVAVTIPKRCNIANRPVGYKCGGVLLNIC